MKSTRLGRLLFRWHQYLDLPRHPPHWYRERLREELSERRLAVSVLSRLSESADVFYIISRAHYDGIALRRMPKFNIWHHSVVYSYLILKYTSRWSFYRLAGRLCRVPERRILREVINPRKNHKLYEVACRHNIDPAYFKRVCCRLRKVWPLFP